MHPAHEVFKAARGRLASAVAIVAAVVAPALTDATELIHTPWGDQDLVGVDYVMPVCFMPAQVGRIYSMQLRPIPRTAEERARNVAAAATPIDRPAPFTPTWLTLFDFTLVASPALSGRPALQELYMPSNPWRATMRWTEFELVEGSRHEEYRTHRSFVPDAGLSAGYKPPAGYAALEQLPGGAALQPREVAATVLLRVDDYMFFDAQGRLLGIQDGRGNGYTYQWLADDVTTQGAITVARREVRVEHTEGRWMRATWSQSTDRSASNPALHMTSGEMRVTVDDECTTITYTYLPVPANDPTRQGNLIQRFEKEWTVPEHPGFVQRRVEEYTYSADAACLGVEPAPATGACDDAQRPKSSPNLLMTQRVSTKTLADKPVETKQHVFAHRWIARGDYEFGRPVTWDEVVPVCIVAREYKGAPPATGAPIRAEAVQYGPSRNPAEWRHLTGPVQVTEIVGARVELSEFELDPVRTITKLLAKPSVADATTSWHYWFESEVPSQPLVAGMTLVNKGPGLGAEPSYYHRFLGYETPSPDRLETGEEVRNTNVGRLTPWQDWKALRSGGGDRYVRRMGYRPDDGSIIARVPDRFEEMDDSVVEFSFDVASRAANLPARIDFAMRDNPTTHTVMLEYDDPARNPSKARGLPTRLRRAAANGESRPNDACLDLFYANDGTLDRIEVRTASQAEPRRVIRRTGTRIEERWRYEVEGQPRRFGRLTDYSVREVALMAFDDLLAQSLETRPRESVRDVIIWLILTPQS